MVHCVLIRPLSPCVLSYCNNFIITQTAAFSISYGEKSGLKAQEAVTRLVDIGYDPVFGARPLKRAVQKYIQGPLANEILKGSFNDAATVKVNLDKEGSFTFENK